MEKNAMLNLRHGFFHLSRDMEDMVLGMEKDDVCTPPFHLLKLKSTYNRIRKHESRGLMFDRWGGMGGKRSWLKRLDALIEREEEREEGREYEKLVASGAQ